MPDYKGTELEQKQDITIERLSAHITMQAQLIETQEGIITSLKERNDRLNEEQTKLLNEATQAAARIHRLEKQRNELGRAVHVLKAARNDTDGIK